MLRPNTEIPNPNVTNATDIPAAKATGPNRCACKAEASTMGAPTIAARSTAMTDHTIDTTIAEPTRERRRWRLPLNVALVLPAVLGLGAVAVL